MRSRNGYMLSNAPVVFIGDPRLAIISVEPSVFDVVSAVREDGTEVNRVTHRTTRL